jgi:hypothetical protein
MSSAEPKKVIASRTSTTYGFATAISRPPPANPANWADWMVMLRIAIPVAAPVLCLRTLARAVTP